MIKLLSPLTDDANAMELERQANSAAPTQPRMNDVLADVTHPGMWSGSELLAKILDGVADGIAAHDASGQLIFINDAGARMCGYESASGALSASPTDFLARFQVFDDGGAILVESELPGPLAARGRVVPERIVRLQLRHGGGERWLSVKATPVLDRRGGVRMSISILRDVTRERCAEAERDRAVRELEMERARLAALVDQLRGGIGATEQPREEIR